jgi:ribonuclease G
VKRTLLWDMGPGEIRAGLLEDGVLAEFRIVRQRRQLALYAAGEFYTARMLRREAGNRAMVDLGGQEALLQPAPPLAEGALLAVEMTRGPVPEPGRWKLPQVRPAKQITPQREAGWHFSDEPWVLLLRKFAAGVDEVLCTDAQSANETRGDLGGDGPPVRIDPDLIAEADFDGLIDQAVTGEFAIPGGLLSIERTRAMTLIDVDGGGDPLALNCAAAREIPRLLRLLDIGGPVGVDFVSLADGKARKQVDAVFAAAAEGLGPHERTAINGFGLAQLIRARRGPSVPELLCGTLTGRLSLESRAVALLRDAGRSTGIGARQLVAPPAVIALIRQWPEEVLALRSALGVELELLADPAATGYGHVHVSQS